MVMCSRCHKRVAVVFVTKFENGKKSMEGVCIKCAKELGLPVDNMLGDVMNKFGIPSDQLEMVEDEINQIMGEEGMDSDELDEDENGVAPAIDMNKLFREAGLASEQPHEVGEAREKKTENAPKDKKKHDKKKKFLTAYCRNLTGKAREGKLDVIVGRERELARVIQILCRRQKNNPCLIGEPGVGKTAIAEGLAQRIVSGDVPYKLRGKEVYLVDLTALVAGTQFRGQFESRILGLVNEVVEAGNVILVIDEVHNIVGTGGGEGSLNAANILKPALSRGDIQVIGATTLNEYRKFIEKDTALERRFQPVTVDEPSLADTVEMLKGIKHYYEEFHSIVISDDILHTTVTLSERYITDRYLPDKAIDLLDEAASHLSINSAPLNEARELREKLIALKDQREGLEAEALTEAPDGEGRHYEKIATIKAQEMQVSARLQEVEPACHAILLTKENLAEVIEVWTGVPAKAISENEFEKIEKLEERLRARIIGQDKAVSAVARAIKRNRAGISYKRKPVSFIFAGPTGVGKTELVKTLAADLFHSPETLIRLDMSEFMEKHSVSRLIGAPPGYVGYDDAGQLTEKIRRRPYSVVLFDEIEKAHPDVLNVLLQILDDGMITDAHGKKVNFENTLIVMTTNAGSDHSSATAGFATTAEDAAEDKTQKALSTFLRPEFINRVDEIITFRSLDVEDFVDIARIMLEELRTVLAEKEIRLVYTDEAAALIARRSYSKKFGARHMRRFIQTHVEDAIAEEIIANYARAITQIHIGCREGGEELDITCM